jgi:DNA-binding NarL/FixJ family response regulator
MNSKPLRRVVTADDERVGRCFLADLLATMPDVHLVAEADNGRDLAALLEREHPDVAIVDAYLPDVALLATLQRRPRIVYLTRFEAGPSPIAGEHVFTPPSVEALRAAFARGDLYEERAEGARAVSASTGARSTTWTPRALP